MKDCKSFPSVFKALIHHLPILSKHDRREREREREREKHFLDFILGKRQEREEEEEEETKIR